MQVRCKENSSIPGDSPMLLQGAFGKLPLAAAPEEAPARWDEPFCWWAFRVTSISFVLLLDQLFTALSPAASSPGVAAEPGNAAMELDPRKDTALGTWDGAQGPQPSSGLQNSPSAHRQYTSLRYFRMVQTAKDNTVRVTLNFFAFTDLNQALNYF